MKTNLNQELLLPCGAVLKNRIAKSAMSENMATADHRSNPKFDQVYRKWSQGGAGLLMTGNIMIDGRALGEFQNVVIEKNHDFQDLKSWAKAGTEKGNHLWTQLNHPGKQSPKFLSPKPVAPSAIALSPPLNQMFHTPRALSEEEIEDIIKRFAYGARISKEVGFTGVQIHGAHGYLVSQFLSPLHNQRKDKWGGSLQNRMRFVREIYKEIRKEVGNQFPLGIKLNSADFQRGGFTQEESMEVVQALSEEGMDLIEISGGTYEAPEMMGIKKSKSTQEREAYFLEYCQEVRKRVKTPLMLTGGLRTLAGMQEALGSSCDVIGLGRSLVLQPDFPRDLLQGKETVSLVRPLTTGSKKLDKLLPLEITWYTEQIHRMGRGLEPKPKLNVTLSLVQSLFSMGVQGLRRVRAKNV